VFISKIVLYNLSKLIVLFICEFWFNIDNCALSNKLDDFDGCVSNKLNDFDEYVGIGDKFEYKSCLDGVTSGDDGDGDNGDGSGGDDGGGCGCGCDSGGGDGCGSSGGDGCG
jgi:hypothetical protein